MAVLSTAIIENYANNSTSQTRKIVLTNGVHYTYRNMLKITIQDLAESDMDWATFPNGMKNYSTDKKFAEKKIRGLQKKLKLPNH